MFDIDSITPTGVARFTLDGVPVNADKSQPAALILKHANADNPAFAAAHGRLAAGRRAQGLAPHGEDVEWRKAFAKIFAQTVVVDWENVAEAESPSPVAFSAAKCEELLVLLAVKRADMFLAIVRFASTADNFLGDPVVLGKS